MFLFYFVIFIWIFLSTITDSASNENLSEQPYPAPSDEDIKTINERFQQIMQGPDVRWKEPKLKTDKINVKAELEKLNISYIYQPQWPDHSRKLGAVSAVTFDKDGNVVVFHRVDRIWTQDTFNLTNFYMEQYKGPIRENTVIAFDRRTGKILYEWGKNMFYMPHGLTIDDENNAWITDVALHQVLKFGPKGSNDKPLLQLGTAFTPGIGNNKFCKPTAVAVLPNGDFFVADGYCNARILKFSKSGDLILSWGKNSFQGRSYEVPPKNFFAIPHALTYAKDKDLLCVADRENGRVQCFNTSNGTFYSQYHSQLVGDRLFSLDYAPISDGQLFVVNGPIAELGFSHNHDNEVRGYVFDMKTKQVLSKFGPNDLEFSNPHDIAVLADGSEIYVAELDPPKIHKFINRSLAKTSSISAAKPTATIGDVTDQIPGQQDSEEMTKLQPGSTALLVIIIIVIFALLTFGMALLVSRRRKRGCYPFGIRNRRHAWDFPSVKPDGFTLGNLLDRKRGFEKLDQNASDEEPDASTNMLSSAQFA